MSSTQTPVEASSTEPSKHPILDYLYKILKWNFISSYVFQFFIFLVVAVVYGVLAWNTDSTCANDQMVISGKVLFWTAAGLGYLFLLSAIIAAISEEDKLTLLILNLSAAVILVFGIVYAWIIAIASRAGANCNGLYSMFWIGAIILSSIWLVGPLIMRGVCWVYTAYKNWQKEKEDKKKEEAKKAKDEADAKKSEAAKKAVEDEIKQLEKEKEIIENN